MVKMKKHILYIALGLLALIAIITTVLAIGGVVTLPVIGQPAIEQPAVSDSQPHGPTAAEVEALIDALPQPVTNADSIKVLIARLAYRELSTISPCWRPRSRSWLSWAGKAAKAA